MKSYYSINTPIITGTFIREEAHRFLCTVRVNSEEVECYIPCSSHLDHFIDLVGKRVLLIPNKQANSRTAYSVLAVKHNRHNILLNTSLANKAAYHYITYNKFKSYGKDCIISCEKSVHEYKSDILIEWQSTREVVEIKSVISINAKSLFPTVYSKRAIKQLENFLKFPDSIRIHYWLISLSPYIEEVSVNKAQSEYYELFYKCLARGMICKAYQCSLVGSKVKIVKELPIVL